MSSHVNYCPFRENNRGFSEICHGHFQGTILSLWVWVCAWNLAVRPYMTCITFLNDRHFEVMSRSTARSNQGQSNARIGVSKKRLPGGNRALWGGYKTWACGILHDLECWDCLGGRRNVLYLQNCRNKIKIFCVENVQNWLPHLIALSVLVISLSPQAFPIDINISSLNILWIRPDTL